MWFWFQGLIISVVVASEINWHLTPKDHVWVSKLLLHWSHHFSL
jgi:hypothetical protein